jgi:hypothetical protein
MAINSIQLLNIVETKFKLVKVNSIQKIRNSIIDIAAIIVIIAATYNFSENPFVASVVIVFFILAIVISGYNQISITERFIEFSFRHPIKYLSKNWVFDYTEITKIEASLPLTKKDFLIGELISGFISSSSIWNKISISQITGKKININTKVYKKDILEVLKLVKEKNKSISIIID